MNKSDAFMKNDFQTLHSENQLVNWCLSPTPLAQMDLDQCLPHNGHKHGSFDLGVLWVIRVDGSFRTMYRILTENLDYTFFSSLFHCC